MQDKPYTRDQSGPTSIITQAPPPTWVKVVRNGLGIRLTGDLHGRMAAGRRPASSPKQRCVQPPPTARAPHLVHNSPGVIVLDLKLEELHAKGVGRQRAEVAWGRPGVHNTPVSSFAKRLMMRRMPPVLPS